MVWCADNNTTLYNIIILITMIKKDNNNEWCEVCVCILGMRKDSKSYSMEEKARQKKGVLWVVEPDRETTTKEVWNTLVCFML